MPDLDGFELAAMIREHPRFQKTAIIFISAIHLTDIDRLRGYEMGAVDYVPVPVVPEVLRAKVRVFAELYRKTRQLETLNAELEERVAERTAELEASTARLRQSEQRRSLALAAGRWARGIGIAPTATASGTTGSTASSASTGSNSASPPRTSARLIHPDDWQRLQSGAGPPSQGPQALPDRISRPAAERRDALVHRHGGAQHRRHRPGRRGSAASPSTSPIARRPRSGRRCWPARSIIAPRTRSRWCSRSCG